MAAPAGIDRNKVISTAAEVLAERGSISGVALREVAQRLGVRTQSLYAHVDGLDGLRRALAIKGLEALSSELTFAAVGRAGADAVAAIVRAYFAFAVERPGLYDASLRPPGVDPELVAATEAVTRPLNLVFASYGLAPADALHWYRIVFAGVHGFAVLQRSGLFTLPGDPADSLELMIAAFVHQIETEAGVRSAS